MYVYVYVTMYFGIIETIVTLKTPIKETKDIYTVYLIYVYVHVLTICVHFKHKLLFSKLSFP